MIKAAIIKSLVVVMTLIAVSCGGGTLEKYVDNRDLLTNGDAVDMEAPVLLSVLSKSPDGYYIEGNIVEIELTFNEKVVLSDGNLLLSLNSGAVVKVRPFEFTETVSVKYIVGAGENSADLEVDTISLIGGTLTDAAGNSAVLDIPKKTLGGASDIIIDTTPPAVTSVFSSTADGDYGESDDIQLKINFSEKVKLSGGNLEVSLDSGVAVAVTPFDFSENISAVYTVSSGENSSDLTVSGIQTASGGKITDAAGNSAVLTVPTGKNVADTSDIIVSTTNPSVTLNQATGQDDPTNNQTITYTVVFSKAINPSTFDSSDISHDGTASGVTWNEPSTGDNITWTITTSAVTGDGTVVPSIAANAVLDFSGNNNLASSGTDNSVAYDTTSPAVTVNTLTTKDTTPVITGTLDSGALSVAVNSVNYTAGDGNLSVVGSTWTLIIPAGNELGSANNEVTYNVTASSTDAAGNTGGDTTVDEVTVDLKLPVISATAPASSSSVNNTMVSYTFSEICDTGKITWERTGGTADGVSPHEQALTGSELNAGVHNGSGSGFVLADNPDLVSGAVYDISFDCTDRAGNAAVTVTETGITFSNTVPEIASAETMDTDSNGKIDTYRIAFNKNINDSTFPGFSENSEGSATSDWLVSGHTNIRLIHGSAVSFASDTADDAVIYIRFNESTGADCDTNDQAGCNTGDKPDLTTTASPGLEDLAGNPLGQVQSGDVTEADGAKPLLITARSLSATEADVIFSEAVEETEAQKASNYTIDNGITVSAAARDGSNYKTVHLTTSSQTGGTTYTLTVNTDVKDLANFNLDSNANTAVFDGVVKPVVVGIATVNSTTLTITFNETVTAGSTECSNLSSCELIYTNASLPVKSAVSTAGAGTNSATYTLTVNEMVEGQNYTTYVQQNTVTSVASGEKMGNINNSATFTGDGRPGANISVDTETACPDNSASRVVVQYDQTVDGSALTAGNYAISLCVTGDCDNGTGPPNDSGASNVTDLGGNKYAVDFGGYFDTDESQYRLSIQNVQDSNGNTVPAPTNLNFQCGNDTTPPVLVKADVIASNGTATRVMMTFSEGVDQVTANTAGNYKYDSESYGENVDSAARQSNVSQVLVIYAPGLAEGGHQVRVQDIKDLASTPNTMVDDGITNIQPIIVNAPNSLGDGSIFEDPFNDGTRAGHLVVYDGKLYLGTDSAASKLFEMDLGMTTSQSILIDADGNNSNGTVASFMGYTTTYSDSGTQNPDTTTKGVDTLYAACVGGTSIPGMTGSECTAAGGQESLFIGSLNVSGKYVSYWKTDDKSTDTTTFTFTEGNNPDGGGPYAYRSTVFLVFKDQLWNHFGAEGGGGGRGGRMCMVSGGCLDGSAYGNGAAFGSISSITRIGAGGAIKNGSQTNAVSGHNKYMNAINVLYEWDSDGSGGNESQLYMANGGVLPSTENLGAVRSGHSDGGIVRSKLTYSERDSLPVNCNTSSCPNYWEDVTPGSVTNNTDWTNFISIPYPENSTVTGEANCGTSGIEMDCVRPYNIYVPAMKAIPYMKTATNGDLYMIRNACSSRKVCVNGEAISGTVSISNGGTGVSGSSTNFPGEVVAGDTISVGDESRIVQNVNSNTSITVDQPWTATLSGETAYVPPGINGFRGCDFRTERQVCPSGSEVTQLWMLPANCGDADDCANAWTLVAEYGSTGYTNMAGNNSALGLNNTHISLLEFVGNYIYIGFDNAVNGANIWRADMTEISSGSAPVESDFELVNIAGLDGTSTNQKIFSHITYNDSGTDWLIITTRDGDAAVQIYRTNNSED